jgi:hypothetical protein
MNLHTRTPLQNYRSHRYHWLCELRRVRAQGRIGTVSTQACAKERKAIIGAMVKLRES